jgi:hypothetical protein
LDLTRHAKATIPLASTPCLKKTTPWRTRCVVLCGFARRRADNSDYALPKSGKGRRHRHQGAGQTLNLLTRIFVHQVVQSRLVRCWLPSSVLPLSSRPSSQCLTFICSCRTKAADIAALCRLDTRSRQAQANDSLSAGRFSVPKAFSLAVAGRTAEPIETSVHVDTAHSDTSRSSTPLDDMARCSRVRCRVWVTWSTQPVRPVPLHTGYLVLVDVAQSTARGSEPDSSGTHAKKLV